MICPTGKAEYFFDQDWTAQIRLNGFEKFGFKRRRDIAGAILAQRCELADGKVIARGRASGSNGTNEGSSGTLSGQSRRHCETKMDGDVPAVNGRECLMHFPNTKDTWNTSSDVFQCPTVVT
jgi:hypothetical protein